MPDDYTGRDRRQEDPELARWRGEIEARVVALERGALTVATSISGLDRSYHDLRGDVRVLASNVKEYRDEVKEAADAIEQNRETAVTDLKRTIADTATAGRNFRLTWTQLGVGALLAFLFSVLTVVISLALSGHLA